MDKKHRNKVTAGGVLVAMGVVYGDIGTSPLYVMKALVHGNGGVHNIDETFILGSVSLIFWTLTLLTTVKYVMIALNADNNGEGGIFSLYTLVRQHAKWLIVPAMIGGATLLADGVLTPAVTVTTAIEGLKDIPLYANTFGTEQNVIIAITLTILLILFSIQRFGTDFIGKSFGPIMLGWFTYIGVMGLINFSSDWTMIRALNPYYALQLLVSPSNHLGIFILGNIFLATTGAEALYSDLGHVGKGNIRASWPFVKISLVLNYLGQGAWLMQAKDDMGYQPEEGFNPFFEMMPEGWSVISVVFATLAAIIASQALISGSFTLVSEAIKLKLLPRLHILYPGSTIGQIYIPAVNWLLWFACSLIVIFFRTSANMEAAYGLAITITMLMTTILLHAYLVMKGHSQVVALGITGFFGLIEGVFFISSMAKFFHGGFVAVLMALAIVFIMFVWERSAQIQSTRSKDVHIRDYLPQLKELREDNSYDMYQTNVVFLVPNLEEDEIGREFLYSILDKHPKRARVYWFVNVDVTDEPDTQEYEVDMLGTDYVVLVKLHLGFRVPQSITAYLRQIVTELMADGRLAKQPQKYSITPGREVGDFKFVLINEELSNYTELTRWQHHILLIKLWIKRFTATPASWFGLQYSEVKQETVPLDFGDHRVATLHEVKTY